MNDKPTYDTYNGNGFGYTTHNLNRIGELTQPLCGNWLKKHYKKYPNGKLPKQTMTRGKANGIWQSYLKGIP